MSSVCNFCSFFFRAQAERHAMAELTYLNFFPAFCNHVNQDSFSLSDRNPALNWLWIKREICRLTILNIASGIARSRCSNNIIRSEFSTSLDSAVPFCFHFQAGSQVRMVPRQCWLTFSLPKSVEKAPCPVALEKSWNWLWIDVGLFQFWNNHCVQKMELNELVRSVIWFHL